MEEFLTPAESMATKKWLSVGAGALCKVAPKALNSFPPTFLVALGFILGILIVAVGAIYVGLRVLGELASAF